MKKEYYFTQLLFLILIIACTILAIACGSKDWGSSARPLISGYQPVKVFCLKHNPLIMILDNHGHSMVIPIGDVMSETGGSYTWSPSDEDSDGNIHTHTLVLSSYDVQVLKTNLSLSLTTSLDSEHLHIVTITCNG